MEGLTKLLLLRLGAGAAPWRRAWLSPAEALRARAMASPLRREQYLAGRWALRRLLCERGGRPEDWLLPAQGDPKAVHRQGWLAPRLSLAHSGPWVLAARSWAPGLGVDIEALGKARPWIELARAQGFSPARRYASEAAFVRRWLEHEAAFKAGPGPGPLGFQHFQGPGFKACSAVRGPWQARVQVLRGPGQGPLALNLTR